MVQPLCDSVARCSDLLEARVIIEEWRCDYNADRSHSAHGELALTDSPYSRPRPTNLKAHSDWTTRRPAWHNTPAGSRERQHEHG